MLNPSSDNPLTCAYAKNTRGYLLALQHCEKKLYLPQFLRYLLKIPINIKNRLLSLIS
jgi:hypothetical protein